MSVTIRGTGKQLDMEEYRFVGMVRLRYQGSLDSLKVLLRHLVTIGNYWLGVNLELKLLQAS